MNTVKKRVVCDTNILISALIFPGGPPDEILDLGRQREIELLTSSDIINEFKGVLIEKLGYTKDEAEKFAKKILDISALVAPKRKLNIIKEDEADNRVLECAMEGHADYIISGDTKHLQPLKEYQGVKILSPSVFLTLSLEK